MPRQRRLGSGFSDSPQRAVRLVNCHGNWQESGASRLQSRAPLVAVEGSALQRSIEEQDSEHFAGRFILPYDRVLAGLARQAATPRPEYYPGYYTTWVFDPDGHDIEVVHKS